MMISVENLCKNFGEIKAVQGVSFSANRGEVVGFLGPNGAGKTTTMRMLTGYLLPSAGQINICGHSIIETPTLTQRHLGYLPEGAPAYSEMTPSSFLNFIADIHLLGKDQKKAAIDQIVDLLHLQSVFYRPIETLSKGFRRRVGLAQALLHNPDVLILDEPTDGLDPNQKYEVHELIRKLAKDKAIIISTHILDEVESVCTRAMIISRGRIIADNVQASRSELDKVFRDLTEKFDKESGVSVYH